MKARQQQKKSEAAIYRQIAQDMREKIRQGIWQSQEMIPARTRLAQEYGVGLPTIERAIDLLIADGLLYAQRGRGHGTVVTSHAPALLFSQDADPLQDHELNAQNEVDNELSGTVTQKRLTQGEYSSKTNNFELGIVAADFPFSLYMVGAETDWSPIVVRTLEQAFTSGGGMTTFFERFNGMEHLCSLEEALLALIQDGVDAIAIMNVADAYETAKQVLQIMDTSKIPVILHTWNQPTTLLPCIAYDNVQAGYQATTHLLKAGYQPLVFLNCREAWWVEARLYGARAALRDLGYPTETLKVHYWQEAREQQEIGEYTHDYTLSSSTGYGAGKELFAPNGWFEQHKAMSREIPGIIAPNDWTAYGLLRAIREAEQQPGRDVGVIGFDDRLESRNMGLTSLVPPLAELGREAAQMLLRRLQGALPAPQVYLQSHLVARISTRLRSIEKYHAGTHRTVSA